MGLQLTVSCRDNMGMQRTVTCRDNMWVQGTMSWRDNMGCSGPCLIVTIWGAADHVLSAQYGVDRDVFTLIK